MNKKIIAAVLLLAVIGFQATAQAADDEKLVISGDLTTIYTLGNASESQKIDDANATGAYFNDPVTGTRKNGFYTAANLYATFTPFPWFESYFKVYALSRPGSFHLPLQMENLGRGDLTVTFDAVYARLNIFSGLALDLPVDLYVKGGKYKAQAAQYGIISKYKTEQVLYMMNTKTDFTYELGITHADPNYSVSFATNYLFDESVQRLFDEDGGLGNHGDPVLNEYAPQFLVQVKLWDFNNISGELLFGQNVSNIYSGLAAGLSARYLVELNDSMSVPVGIQFGFFEKNIDLLGQAAVATPIYTGGSTTVDFRNSWAAALGTGLRMHHDFFDADINVAGAYNSIKHYTRNDLNIIKASADAMLTVMQKYFFGGGIILGTLTDAEWITRDDARDKETYYEHTFTLAENMGFEIYGGVNVTKNAKFIIGFNKNKGISLNNMLEAKHEGQMKYKQENSNWSQDKLAEAGGIYFKIYARF